MHAQHVAKRTHAPDRRRTRRACRRASRRRRRRCFRARRRSQRRYELRFLELTREKPLDVGSVRVTPFEVGHPSGAPPYALRFEASGKVLGFTGDTRMGGEPGAGRAAAPISTSWSATSSRASRAFT